MRIFIKQDIVNAYIIKHYLSGNRICTTVEDQDGNRNYLDSFLSELTDPNEITERVLPLLDDVKNSQTTNRIVKNHFGGAYINKNMTYFIRDLRFYKGKIEATQDAGMFMPTDDFEAILIIWKSFLEALPIALSKI